MKTRTIALLAVLGLGCAAAGFLAGVVLFRPEPLTRVVASVAPENPSGGAEQELSLAAALAAGMVVPRTAVEQPRSVSPVGERSLTLALEAAGELPELTARTADIQRTETLLAAWDETGPEDRELRGAIIDELRVRQMPQAREFAEEMVESEAAPDRFIGAVQLRTLGDPDAVAALEAAFAVETDPTAELMEGYALSRLDGPALSGATRERVAEVVPEEWRMQDEMERGGLFDLSVLDGTELEDLKPEFAWWTGELARAAIIEAEVNAASENVANAEGGQE